MEFVDLISCYNILCRMFDSGHAQGGLMVQSLGFSVSIINIVILYLLLNSLLLHNVMVTIIIHFFIIMQCTGDYSGNIPRST